MTGLGESSDPSAGNARGVSVPSPLVPIGGSTILEKTPPPEVDLDLDGKNVLRSNVQVPQPDPIVNTRPLNGIDDLIGLTDFSRSSEYTYGLTSTYPVVQRGSYWSSPARTYPDYRYDGGDIVRLVGDTMYVINPYRGLILIDVSDPGAAQVIGNVPIIGRPVDLYVQDDTAIVLASTGPGLWYSDLNDDLDEDCSANVLAGEGSQLVIIDVSTPTSPQVLERYGLKGFVIRSWFEDDILYLVSNCMNPRQAGTNNYLGWHSYLMSVSLIDPRSPQVVDCADWTKVIKAVLVKDSTVYMVSDMTLMMGYSRVEGTSVQVVGYSPNERDFLDFGQFNFPGEVDLDEQIDVNWDSFTAFTSSGGRWPLYKVQTFDVSSKYYIECLGVLDLPGRGELMTTRYHGTQLYVVTLPPNPQPLQGRDPLEIIDLSDPTEPVLCDTLEIPGWIDQIDVRGDQLLTVGMDAFNGWNNVAVSLFDVSDPFNISLQNRLVFRGNQVTSRASTDLRAMAVDYVRGLLLVPFAERDSTQAGIAFKYGVNVIAMDLKAGRLDLMGSYDTAGSSFDVLLIGEWALSVSSEFLGVTCIEQVYSPQMVAEIDLCPEVLDLRLIDGCLVELVRELKRDRLQLRVFEEGGCDLGTPISIIDLGRVPARWFWMDTTLIVVRTEIDGRGGGYAFISSHDLIDPRTPRSYLCLFPIESSLNIRSSYFQGYSRAEYNWPSWFEGSIDRTSFHGNPAMDNPIMLEHQRLALYSNDVLYIVDVSGPSAAKLLSSTEVGTENFLGLMPAGRDVYVISWEKVMDTWGSRYLPMYRYDLQRVDLGSPSCPSVGPKVRVPGLPVDVVSDGDRVYTTCNWYSQDSSYFWSSINEVRIEDDVATIVSARKLTNPITQIVNGYLITTSGNVGPGYYWAEIQSGQTYITVSRLDGMKTVGAFSLQGPSMVAYVEDGLIMLKSSGLTGSSIVTFDLAESGVLIESCPIVPEGYQVIRYDDTLYVIQGIYGVHKFELDG